MTARRVDMPLALPLNGALSLQMIIRYLNFPGILTIVPSTYESVSGVFWVKNAGITVAVIKPGDMEPGACFNKTGFRNKVCISGFHGSAVGQGVIREYLAFSIGESFGVPETRIVHIKGHRLGRQGLSGHKLVRASIQKFVDGESIMNGFNDFDKSEIQALTVLDLLLGNCDRHFGNALYKDEKLIPIDHGNIAPPFGTDWRLRIDQAALPDAQEFPLLPETVALIDAIDPTYNRRQALLCGLSLDTANQLCAFAHVLKTASKCFSLDKIFNMWNMMEFREKVTFHMQRSTMGAIQWNEFNNRMITEYHYYFYDVPHYYFSEDYSEDSL